jgi:hypothetical protein
MPDNHGVSVEAYGAFEVVTVSFALPAEYAAAFKALCEANHTTAKEYLSRHVKGAVVTNSLK